MATPLLSLLAVYGLLIVTGTPVRQVPGRLAELGAMFGYNPISEWDDEEYDDEEDGDAALDGRRSRGEIRRGVIRLKGALEPGDQRRPYDPQVAGDRRTPGRPRRAPGPAAAVPEARIGEGLLEDLGFTTETDQAPPADEPATRSLPEPEPEPEPVSAPAAARPVPSGPVLPGEQLTLSGARAGAYTLPPSMMLRPGTKHQTRTKANDKVVADLQAVFDGLQGGRDGDRVHPGADGDPVRDRA